MNRVTGGRFILIQVLLAAERDRWIDPRGVRLDRKVNG